MNTLFNLHWIETHLSMQDIPNPLAENKKKLLQEKYVIQKNIYNFLTVLAA